MTSFQFNDGGRAAAGYRGNTGDCVTRAIAIATGMPYQDAYALVNAQCGQEGSARKYRRSTARTGVKKTTTRKVLAALGWTWHPTMGIGTGCTVHLRADELPHGRLIVSVSKHLVAVIDGVIHDTHDPNDRGCTIYPIDTPRSMLPAKAWRLENGNGWAYTPERCVYGYWTREER